MDINVDLLQQIIIFFGRKTSGGTVKNENISNKELAEELNKPIIRKFEKRKVHSTFIDNNWGADLADMQLIGKLDKRFRFLLSVIDIYSKLACIISFKDEKGITINNAFQKFLKQSNHKPSKIWVDTDSRFYKRSMKSWLGKNAI